MSDTDYNEWLDSYQNHGLSFEDWKAGRAGAVQNNEAEMPEAQAKALEKINDQIYKRKTERAVAVDEDGNIVFQKDASRGARSNRVGFTESEKRQIQGTVVTHNHPGTGSTFSAEDFPLIDSANLKGLQVTSARGTDTVYKMRDTASGTDLRDAFQKAMDDAFQNEMSQLRQVADDFKQGLIDSDARNERDLEITQGYMDGLEDWLRVHTIEYGFRYTFEPRN